MALFGLLGDEDSAQRRQQMMMYFMMEQQRQQQEIARQQAAAAAAANKPATPTAPTSANPEGYLGARLGSAGLSGADADRVASLYRSAVSANPNLDQAAAYEQAYGTATSDYQRSLQNQLDQMYGTGYSTKTFADTADDAIIDAILGKQRLAAEEGIERASSRGQLNEAGYNAAMSGLGDIGTAARSEANTLGGAVLSRYRQNLDDALAGLYGTAGKATLGSNFDLTPGTTDIANRVSGMQGSLSGDVTSALGDRNFYDLGAILGKAGAEQGFVNPGKIAIETMPTEEEQRRRRQTSQVF